MTYDELTEQVSKAIARAKPVHRRKFAESALETLLNASELENIDQSDELNKDGLAAFHEARTGYHSATSETVAEWVERIDSGCQSEGNMQPELLAAMLSLEGWSEFLAGEVSGVEVIAEQLLESADFREPAPQDNALASDEVSAVYKQIIATLA